MESFKDIQPNYSGITSYPHGECTWGAKALAPWAGDYWGNGGQWAASARSAGFTGKRYSKKLVQSLVGLTEDTVTLL